MNQNESEKSKMEAFDLLWALTIAHELNTKNEAIKIMFLNNIAY